MINQYFITITLFVLFLANVYLSRLNYKVGNYRISFFSAVISLLIFTDFAYSFYKTFLKH